MQAFLLPLDTVPMEARSASELPAGEGWQYEPKWDGFRCLVFRSGKAVDLRAKSGKPLGRYFPEVVAYLAGLKGGAFVADGELVIETEAGLSFDALQMRLHPAPSRIAKLSVETPAKLILFDLLATGKSDALWRKPLSDRRDALESFVRPFLPSAGLAASPFTLDKTQADHWLAQAGHGRIDGVVAKRRDEAYQPGERAMVKVKRLRTADCVVGGFRTKTGSDEVGSLLLGLYDEAGQLNHVGFTSTITNEERPALTRRLRRLAGPSAFSGRSPGAPSRWSTDKSTEWEPVKPELVVEVRFDHVTGERFRHGTALVRWRPDKAPEQCTMEQLRS